MKHYKKMLSIVLIIAMLFSVCAMSTVYVSAAASGSQVYFDNSSYNWENVYVYAYGTKENAKWPGQLMDKDSSGMYTMIFPAAYTSENIIFNNGLEKGEGKEQYPEAAGLSLKTGECKLLTADNQWVDYGKMDDHGYGFAYVQSGGTFSTESLAVKLGLKNADKGYYSVDGAPKVAFKNGDIISVGQGKIGNSSIKLTLTATGADDVKTEKVYTYNKTFTASKTYFSSKSDGHTTEAEGGYYGTNPNMQLGQYKNITVDGKTDDWDSSMIIAQGVANDDPRVYMPSSMHEQPWDGYALYGAWDDENLYFMWEMTNTTYITSPSDNFAASNEARPWRNSIPMYLALSVNPEIQATGKAVGVDKSGNQYTNPFVWGCDGGVAKDGGTAFTTHVDTLIAMDSNNSNGGASIFKADTMDTDGTYMFNYDTRIPIGVSSFEKQDNKNGFKIKYANGTKSSSIYGINAPKGSRKMGDNLDLNSNWIDFMSKGYKASYGYIYEVAIPMSLLGIDREYVETKGIGAMQILTYGTSAMDTLPHDPSVLDNANVEYGPDPSTSHEKDDIDNITVPLARMGALLSDTEVHYAPFEVNFGADLSSGQSPNKEITLSAEGYNNSGNVTYSFAVNGETVSNATANTAKWTPTQVGEYEISVTATDSEGSTVTEKKTFVIFDPTAGKLIGDVNGDGKIDITDARDIQKYSTKALFFDEDQLICADSNSDGHVDIKDTTHIQKKLAGLI